jgi:replication-associated recombination protein RarA
VVALAELPATMRLSLKETSKMPTSKTPYQIKLIDNYEFDEVASAIQKCIRRNMEYEACWFAFVMHESGYHKYMWRRLVIIASEDIGNSTPDAAVLVNALLQNP